MVLTRVMPARTTTRAKWGGGGRKKEKKDEGAWPFHMFNAGIKTGIQSSTQTAPHEYMRRLLIVQHAIAGKMWFE